jgi:hypothetical protein
MTPRQPVPRGECLGGYRVVCVLQRDVDDGSNCEDAPARKDWHSGPANEIDLP